MIMQPGAAGVIDCDIHNTVPLVGALFPYLSTHWREYISQSAFKGPIDNAYPAGAATSARPDTALPTGSPPGSSLASIQKQVLDAWGVEYGILTCAYAIESLHNPDAAVALASAVNEWQIAEWLEPEPRLRASIIVPYEDGQSAAVEIDRRATDPRFAQVLLVARTREPLGRRKYWPMYEAAAHHDLPIGIHFGGAGGWPLTGAGWPSFYFEDHTGMPQAFQAQLISLIYEGVFERFPNLKVVLIEGGLAWLPPLMWRLDRAWQRLGEEVPHVKHPPSEYIRRHCWVTTQPMEEPPQPAYFWQLLEQLDMNDRLMFATDYPHWDFDAPDSAFPIKLPPDLRQKFMAENARALYRF